MRIFNLTDVTTPKLLQRKLVNQHFAVGGKLVAPGESVEVKGSSEDHPHLRHVLKVGAAAIDELPAHYTHAKATPVKVTFSDAVPVAEAPVLSKRKGS